MRSIDVCWPHIRENFFMAWILPQLSHYGIHSRAQRRRASGAIHSAAASARRRRNGVASVNEAERAESEKN